MTTKRMDHVSVVVEDLPAAIGFFTTLGMGLKAKGRSKAPGWTASAFIVVRDR